MTKEEIKKKIKIALILKNSNMRIFAKTVLGSSYDNLIKKLNNKTAFSFEDVSLIVKNIEGLKYEDFEVFNKNI